MNNLPSNSILFVGHISIDAIVKDNKTNNPTLGGTVSFGALALSTYSPDINIRIISIIGKRNFNDKLLDKVRNRHINLDGIKWADADNTNFVLDYYDHSRTLTLKSRSPDLDFSDVPKEYVENPPDLIILAPLCNEISHDYLSMILNKFPNALIGMDLQGFIRKINDDGEVSYEQEKNIILNMRKIIDLIGERLVLKGSEIEMKLLAGGSEDLNEIMSHFNKFNLKGIYIMTLGEAGSMLIKHGEELLHVPAFTSRGVIDETGAGDVYLAIFLHEFINSDMTWDSVRNAACLGSSAASFLVEAIGTAGFGTKEEIIERVKSKNYIE
jgi:sugar/nucleoside kinase (ribokinase family)